MPLHGEGQSSARIPQSAGQTEPSLLPAHCASAAEPALALNKEELLAVSQHSPGEKLPSHALALCVPVGASSFLTVQSILLARPAGGVLWGGGVQRPSGPRDPGRGGAGGPWTPSEAEVVAIWECRRGQGG